MIWDEHTYLMVDTALVESSHGTSMVRAEAWKYPANPIANEGDTALFGGVPGYRLWIVCLCRDGGRYRLWYQYETAADAERTKADRRHRRLGYAESNDGLSFQPIHLDLTFTVLQGREDLRLGSILHDPADHTSPYKALILRLGDVNQINPALRAKYPQNHTFSRHGSNGWFVWGYARSRDGVDWQLPDHTPNLVDAILEGPSMYRALDGGLVIANQPVTRVSDKGWRKVTGWVTYDGIAGHRLPGSVYEVPDSYAMVSPLSQLSLNWHNTPWVQSHVALVPARKGPTMVALHGNLYGATGCETYAQVSDIGLAVSETGYWYQQVWPFQPFLRRGDMGDWDSGLVVQQALVDTEDETRLYYLASDVGNADGCPYRLGIATIGRDRYGYRVLAVGRDYATAKDRRGTVQLKPIDLPALPTLSLNIDGVSQSRTARVAIADDAGNSIPGFTFDDCLPVTTPGIVSPVAWRAADIRTLAGCRVVLQIELHSPDCRYADQHSPRLYALYTAPPTS